MQNKHEQTEQQCVHWHNDGYAEFGEMEFITNTASAMHTVLYNDEFANLFETLRSC